MKIIALSGFWDLKNNRSNWVFSATKKEEENSKIIGTETGDEKLRVQFFAISSSFHYIYIYCTIIRRPLHCVRSYSQLSVEQFFRYTKESQIQTVLRDICHCAQAKKWLSNATMATSYSVETGESVKRTEVGADHYQNAVRYKTYLHSLKTFTEN